MEKIWTKSEVLRFLRENPLASIAVNSEMYPISSVIIFYIDDEFNLYFGTGRESHKARALMAIPRLSFSVWKSNSALIQGSGSAVEVSDENEVGIRMDDIVKSTRNLPDFWPPLLGVWKHDYILFKIKMDILRVLDFSGQHIKEKAPKFTEFKF